MNNEDTTPLYCIRLYPRQDPECCHILSAASPDDLAEQITVLAPRRYSEGVSIGTPRPWQTATPPNMLSYSLLPDHAHAWRVERQFMGKSYDDIRMRERVRPLRIFAELIRREARIQNLPTNPDDSNWTITNTANTDFDSGLRFDWSWSGRAVMLHSQSEYNGYSDTLWQIEVPPHAAFQAARNITAHAIRHGLMNGMTFSTRHSRHFDDFAEAVRYAVRSHQA